MHTEFCLSYLGTQWDGKIVQRSNMLALYHLALLKATCRGPFEHLVKRYWMVLIKVRSGLKEIKLVWYISNIVFDISCMRRTISQYVSHVWTAFTTMLDASTLLRNNGLWIFHILLVLCRWALKKAPFSVDLCRIPPHWVHVIEGLMENSIWINVSCRTKPR